MFGDKGYKMIDSHFHIRGCNNGDLMELMSVIPQIQQSTGIYTSNAASIPQWDVDSVGQNVLCILYKALYPSSYAYAGLDYYADGIDKSSEGRLKQVKLFMDMGFDGMKSIEYKPTARKKINKGLNDPSYSLFFEYMEKNAIPVLWHVADPEENWDESKCSEWIKEAGWCYGDGTFLSKEKIYQEVDEVLTAYPDLQVVFAHLYFLSADLERAASFLDKHPNVRFDVTPGIEMYYNFEKRHGEWREFFIQYQDRLVFGSDNGWGDDVSAADKVMNGCTHIAFLREYFETNHVISYWNGDLTGMELPPSVLEQLYCENFMVMQKHQAPKKVNVSLALEYSENLYHNIVNNSDIDQNVKLQVKQAIETLRRY